MYIVLQRLEAEVSKPDSILSRTDDNRRAELSMLAVDCERVLRVLSQILDKYNALSQEKRSATKLWQRVKFGNGAMLDLEKIRSEVATYTNALTLFLNLLLIGSQGKVEKYMDSHGGELREIKSSLHYITASMQASCHDEKSVLTTYSQDDKLVWKSFRRELIKEGFSSQVLYKHKKTIKQYVMELGERGALDEVLPDVAGPSRENTAASSSTEQDQNVLIMASQSKDEYDDRAASIGAKTLVSATPISETRDSKPNTVQSPAPESDVEVPKIDEENGPVASALVAEHERDPITAQSKHAPQSIATESQSSTSDDRWDDGDDDTTEETERSDPSINVTNILPQVLNDGRQQLSVGGTQDTNLPSQNLNTPVAEGGRLITTRPPILRNEPKHASVEDVPDEEYLEGAHPNCDTQSEKEPNDDIGDIDLRPVLWSLPSIKPVGEQNNRAPYLPNRSSNVPSSKESSSEAIQNPQSIIPRRRPSGYYLDEYSDEEYLTESNGYTSSQYQIEGSSSNEDQPDDGDVSSDDVVLEKREEYFKQRRSRRERYWKAGNAHIPVGESLLSSLGPDFDVSNVSRSGWSRYLDDFHEAPVSAQHDLSSNFQPDALPGVLASAPFVSSMTRGDSSKHWRPVLHFIENDFFWLKFEDIDDPYGRMKMLGPNEPKDAHLYKPVMVKYDKSASGSTDSNKDPCLPVLAAYMPPERRVEPGYWPLRRDWSSDNDEPRYPKDKSQHQRNNQSEVHMPYLSDWEDNSDESSDVELPWRTKAARDSGSEIDEPNSRFRNQSSAAHPAYAPGVHHPANHPSSHKSRPNFTTNADAARDLYQERNDERMAARLQRVTLDDEESDRPRFSTQSRKRFPWAPGAECGCKKRHPGGRRGSGSTIRFVSGEYSIFDAQGGPEMGRDMIDYWRRSFEPGITPGEGVISTGS